jgi:hypothetical protein
MVVSMDLSTSSQLRINNKGHVTINRRGRSYNQKYFYYFYESVSPPIYPSCTDLGLQSSQFLRSETQYDGEYPHEIRLKRSMGINMG